MSALGHKRTFAVQNGMSALHPKADIRITVSVPMFHRKNQLDIFEH